MAVTFVSAYLNLNESRPDDKPLQRCFTLFKHLVNTGVQIHLFLSNCFKDLFETEFRNTFNVVVDYIELSDLDTYKELQDVCYKLPEKRQGTHDTDKFMILMNSKVELVKRVIQSNRYESTHFAWVDFNVCHVFKNLEESCSYIQDMGASTPKTPLLAIPGSWQRGQYSEKLYNTVNWRYSGGFFIGDRDSLLVWESNYRLHFKQLVMSNGVLPWETNIWHALELMGALPPAASWFHGDHDDGIICVPREYFIKFPHRISPIVRMRADLRAYWDGPFSRFHVGKDIEQFIRYVITQNKLPVSVILGISDGFLGSKEYARMRSTPNLKGVNNTGEGDYAAWEACGRVGTYPIVGILCSRHFSRPNMFHLPLDDAVFRDGLDKVLEANGVKQIPWAEKKPQVFWRGGTSGFDRPFLRTQVAERLHGRSYANVALTHGGWPENDKQVADHLFGEYTPASVQTGYKYVMVIDGACIASNHMWVFGTGSVPIIVSHPNNNFWFKQFLIPMVNYVPIKYDLSDLIEKLEWLVANDDEAQKIASCAYGLSKIIFTPSFQRSYIESELHTLCARKYNYIGLGEVYCKKAASVSDINQHLPVLREYAGKCARIVECNLGSGCAASYALATGIVGKPEASYYYVDKKGSAEIDEFLSACDRSGICSQFYAGNDYDCPRMHADLVFIDTWHIYGQLKRELEHWHSHAAKYIIMHDTTIDEWEGESIRGHSDLEKQSKETGWTIEEIGRGVWPAIEEFLAAHHEWKLELRLTNNNGLTVLHRES